MSWSHRVCGINVGDTVRYSRDWLQSTGTFTGDLPRAKSTVTSIKDYGSAKIATVDRGNEDIPDG